MEDVDDAGVRAGDRLELPDPGELSLVGALAREAAAPDDLHRAQLARRASREPDPAVAPAADLLQDLVIGRARRRRGFRRGESLGGRSSSRVSTEPARIAAALAGALAAPHTTRPFIRSPSIRRAARLTA